MNEHLNHLSRGFVMNQHLNHLSRGFVRPKKNICVFPVTRPTLIFPSNPKVFIGIPKK